MNRKSKTVLRRFGENKMSITKVNQNIKKIRSLSLKKESFDTIFENVFDLMKSGYKCVQFPGIHNYVYRARKIEKEKNKDKFFKNVQELWCRKSENISDFGRAHWPEQSVFYCSGSLKTAILEISPNDHDLVTVMRCRRKNAIKIGSVAFGFPDCATFIDATGKKINWGEYKKKKIRLSTIQAQKNNKIDGFLNKVYRDEDNVINSYGDDKYKLTASIAKMYFDNPMKGSQKLDCICYPSVSGLRGATNYAFPKKIADQILEPDSFFVFEIWPGRKFGKFALKLICFSLNYATNGKIKWENIVVK
jgi:hypothetical protein